MVDGEREEKGFGRHTPSDARVLIAAAGAALGVRVARDVDVDAAAPDAFDVRVRSAVGMAGVGVNDAGKRQVAVNGDGDPRRDSCESVDHREEYDACRGCVGVVEADAEDVGNKQDYVWIVLDYVLSQLDFAWFEED